MKHIGLGAFMTLLLGIYVDFTAVSELAYAEVAYNIKLSPGKPQEFSSAQLYRISTA